MALKTGSNTQHARLNTTLSRTDAPLDTELLLQTLVNYEQQGVPDSAGTGGKQGFDLVRQASLDSDLRSSAVSQQQAGCLAGGST